MKIEINSTPEGRVNVTIETPDRLETISREITPRRIRPYPMVPETIGEYPQPPVKEKKTVEKTCKTCGNPFSTSHNAQKECYTCKSKKKAH